MTANSQPSANPPRNSDVVLSGLPTVEPPSGRHILQMFIVPSLIVGSIVVLMLLFTWLFGGPRSPEALLKQLDDPNPEVRWRTASDLAQVLLRDKDLAANADFALALSDRLDNALRSSEPAEKALADRLAKTKDKDALTGEWQKLRGESEWKKLEAERNYIMFLGACLGSFTVPTGVPLLKEMAEQTSGMEPRGLAARRWRAVFALGNLGQKLSKDYPALPDLRKDLIDQELTKASERKDLAPWASPALQELKQRRDGHPSMMGLDTTFEKIVNPKESDPFLRELVALALNFWTGSTAENERMDRLLLKLTYDDGSGGEVLTEMAGEDPGGLVVPGSVSALEVSYLTNRALANRGSKLVRIPMLVDMLDEDYLQTNMKGRRKDGTEITDQAAVVQTLIDTLKAVGELHRQQPEVDISSLRPGIEKLAANPNKAVQVEVKNLQKTLDAK